MKTRIIIIKNYRRKSKQKTELLLDVICVLQEGKGEKKKKEPIVRGERVVLALIFFTIFFPLSRYRFL